MCRTAFSEGSIARLMPAGYAGGPNWRTILDCATKLQVLFFPGHVERDTSHLERKFVTLVDSSNLYTGESSWR
ncbi:hypothetical protein, partial [Bradyrhizobium sp. CCBAU 11361]|uniref:hypothetical protein n=1 Tax=Bradyrhizobium sp. CCBAU 11361 TaxID=1630812 RepID=UPI0023038FED